MSTRDAGCSFGWISIALHWVTAALVLALWLVGDSIAGVPADSVTSRLRLHISVAVGGYLLLWTRIIWRVRYGHPVIEGQSKIVQRLACAVHYLLLAAIAGMLLSGPLLAWSSGVPVTFFGLLEIPNPVEISPDVREVARAIHAFCAKAILWLVMIHIAGALKHLMFHGDETIARMLAPKRR